MQKRHHTSAMKNPGSDKHCWLSFSAFGSPKLVLLVLFLVPRASVGAPKGEHQLTDLVTPSRRINSTSYNQKFNAPVLLNSAGEGHVRNTKTIRGGPQPPRERGNGEEIPFFSRLHLLTKQALIPFTVFFALDGCAMLQNRTTFFHGTELSRVIIHSSKSGANASMLVVSVLTDTAVPFLLAPPLRESPPLARRKSTLFPKSLSS